jgi:hypothetical protein
MVEVIRFGIPRIAVGRSLMQIKNAVLPTLTLLALMAGWSTPAVAATPAAEKAYVVDGSVVHDVGRLLLNVTNWGLLGSHYSVPSPFSDAPSGRWPGAGGVNHLWGAGLWVGAVAGGEHLVTTGQYDSELRATEAPADTIYRLAWNALDAARYPLATFDDDADGAEDEDPFNGRDDDADGQVDEDAAGVGDQHFRAELDDLHAGDLYPDHVPLGIAVVQESYQWSHDSVADIVGFDFTIRNVGDQLLEDVYVGMFGDFDIDDPEGAPNEAGDDLYGHFRGVVANELGQEVPVAVGYMHEGAGATVSGYMGWVVLDHPVDPAGVTAPVEVGMRTFQRFNTMSYAHGGDPSNDLERFESMSQSTDDPGSPATDDYRILVSTGPFAALAPDQEMTVSFALVAGADLDAMLENAADAVTLFRGLAFDRDGAPENGAEFLVRWLGPAEIEVSNEDLPGDDVVVPAPANVALAAAPNPFNPALEIRLALPAAEDARITVVDLRGREVRVLHDGALAAGESRWVWDGRDAAGVAAASGVYLINLDTPGRVLRKAVTLVR